MRGPKIFIVTDPAYTEDEVLRAVAAAGSVFARGELGVQLRDKLRTRAEVRAFAVRLRELTGRLGAWLLINGDVALAKELGADGVHLGGDAVSIAEARSVCGASAFVSIAAHTDQAVRAAVSEGADAALVSPIFPTTSGAPRPRSEIRLKVAPIARAERRGDEPAKAPRGTEAIRAAREVAGKDLLLYALGGVTSDNARQCIRAGADGVAAIRALLDAGAPEVAARAFHEAMKGPS